MRTRAIRGTAMLLFLAAGGVSVWVWQLPDTLAPTGIEHTRGYFAFDMLVGAALVVQALLFLGAGGRPVERTGVVTGVFSLSMGIFCIFLGAMLAYRHMGGVP